MPVDDLTHTDGGILAQRELFMSICRESESEIYVVRVCERVSGNRRFTDDTVQIVGADYT